MMKMKVVPQWVGDVTELHPRDASEGLKTPGEASQAQRPENTKDIITTTTTTNEYIYIFQIKSIKWENGSFPKILCSKNYRKYI